MTEKRFLDVWIVESNTVYREVPFDGRRRLGAAGPAPRRRQARPSGTAEWLKLGATPLLPPYLPQSEPFGVDDEAEALEPVELDFNWKKPAATTKMTTST